MAAPAVSVSIEAVHENQIQEVTLDGQEILIPPLSMSECLAKSAQKIDFSKDESDNKGKPTSEGEKAEEKEKELAPFQPSLWPWDSVRNSLKQAYTEMSVLLDVLNISKEKRYLVLAHVSQDGTESKPAIQLMAKKKGLLTAASVLISGAERLKKSQQELGNRSQNEFHIELLQLRQNWRLKKVGKAIMGDLSYKSAGSRFWQGGTFEVTKNTLLPNEKGDASVSSRSALEVLIPSELEGASYVQVEVKSVSDSMDLMSATLRMSDTLGYPSDAHWQTKLEAAQNVLFCKELFSQLAREAVQLKSSMPHVVVGNQIITNIFPSVQLSISLCHSPGQKEKKVQPHVPKVEHNHVLEHSLHQLLREVHYKSLHLSPPHPVTSTFGVTKRRRLAGPAGMTRNELKEISTSETLLEQIIQQGRHQVLRSRTMSTLDRLAATIPDPQILSHWSCLNSSLESNVKVIITSQGYDGIRPTWQSLDLEIGTSGVKVVTKDRRTLNLSFQEKELEDLIMWQVSQHHVSLSQNLARLMGWQILSVNGCSGIGEMEDFGTASSVQLVAPSGDRMLSVRSGPTSGLKVFVKTDHTQKEMDPALSSLIDPKWSHLSGSFREIDLEQIDGKNFAMKLELVMAMLNRKR